MTSITARLARIDLARDFERHGNGGDPAVAHAFNALSFLFPHAQRIFIDVARAVVWDLGQANARGMKMCSQQKTGIGKDSVRGFVFGADAVAELGQGFVGNA